MTKVSSQHIFVRVKNYLGNSRHIQKKLFILKNNIEISTIWL